MVDIASKMEFLEDAILYGGDQIAYMEPGERDVEVSLTPSDLVNAEIPKAKRTEILANKDAIIAAIISRGYTIANDEDAANSNKPTDPILIQGVMVYASDEEDDENELEIDLTALIGMKKEDAINESKGAGWRIRISKRDGKAYILTRDYRTDRINLEIEKDIVVKAHIG